MIFITGDCHGDYRRFNRKIFPEQKEMTKEDLVIVCGDFGFWDNSKEQRYWRKWLSNKSFTTLWVDGNHENYDLLKDIPVSEWKGGKVQFISDNIIHLMRGQVFELQGKKIFTFGGARSHDIRDGILDPTGKDFKKEYKKLCSRNAMFRVNHQSWWAEELPNKTEMQEGRENLERNGWTVDYIVTHCTASSVQALLSCGQFEADELTVYFEEVRQKCRFKKWFFGHYHDNRNVSMRDILIYEQILRIC